MVSLLEFKQWCTAIIPDATAAGGTGINAVLPVSFSSRPFQVSVDYNTMATAWAESSLSWTGYTKTTIGIMRWSSSHLPKEADVTIITVGI